MRRETQRMLNWFPMVAIMVIVVLATFQSIARAEPLPLVNPTGNVFVQNPTLVQLVRGVILQQMGGLLDQETVTLNLGARSASFALPNTNEELSTIFHILGIDQKMDLNIDDLILQAELPATTLQLKIVATSNNNEFLIKAQWEIPRFEVYSNGVHLNVPKGLFDTPFVIDLNHISVSNALARSGLLIQSDVLVNLSPEGATLNLKKLTTNLDSAHGPKLRIELGDLSINHEPFLLEVGSGDQRITMTSKSIQQGFKSNHTLISSKIKDFLAKTLKSNLKVINETLAKQKPFAAKFEFNPLMKKWFTNKPSPIQKILKDCELDLFATYLQSLSNHQSIQVGTSFVIQKNPLPNTVPPTKIDSKDLGQLKATDDLTLLLQESWLQNLAASPEVQKRLKDWYETNSKGKGITVGTAGFKVHVNAEINSLILVLNLLIDIKNTSKPGSSYLQQFKRGLGDYLELWFGSGKLVEVPIEITARIEGVSLDSRGRRVLKVRTSLPFNSDGTQMINTYHYPSNIDQMTGIVRKDFLKSLQKDIAESVPENLEVPFESIAVTPDLSLTPDQIRITPNKNLLVSFKIGGGKP